MDALIAALIAMVRASAITAICHTFRHGAAIANDGSRRGVYYFDALP